MASGSRNGLRPCAACWGFDVPRRNAFPLLPPGPPYARHALHSEGAVWTEKNCYVDVWIETLHALGLEPLAMLPFASAIDLEGDQWTFYKPSHDELHDLYGVKVDELTVWRPLQDHVLEHLAGGKLVSTEADAFWLPDTAGSDYRRQHVKSTIVLAAIDTEAETARYFHNAGYFELGGEDYRALFAPDGQGQGPGGLPLFAEIMRIDRLRRRTLDDLVAQSRALWCKHLAQRPQGHPVRRFSERLAQDLPWLREQGMASYHLWAFAGIRQLGSAFELASANLRWMAQAGEGGVTAAAQAFDQVSIQCKSLILKGARAVNSGKALDAAALLEQAAGAWSQGMDALCDHFQVDAPGSPASPCRPEASPIPSSSIERRTLPDFK